MLSLKGAIVTADALNCQRAIATQVVAQGGDYVLALKGNQGTLQADVRLYLDDPAHAATFGTRQSGGAGTRCCSNSAEWPYIVDTDLSSR